MAERSRGSCAALSLALHLRDCRDGRSARVELIREPIDGDHSVRVEQEDRECGALPGLPSRSEPCSVTTSSGPRIRN